jgi:hypothetical protein
MSFPIMTMGIISFAPCLTINEPNDKDIINEEACDEQSY